MHWDFGRKPRRWRRLWLMDERLRMEFLTASGPALSSSSSVQAEEPPEATVIDADEFAAAAQDPGMTEYLRAAHDHARAVRHL